MTDEITLAMLMLKLCLDSGATLCQSISALNLAVTLLPVIFKPESETVPRGDFKAAANENEIERLKIECLQLKH